MSSNFTSDVIPPSNSSVSLFDPQCVGILVGRSALTIISCTYSLVVLPLSSFVLYLGVQRWRRRRSAFITHSDFFTYNMAVMELLGVLGYVLYYCSSYSDLPLMMSCGLLISSFTWFGQSMFPILTCVERYLAAVHPIAYRGLRRAGGVRIRNVSIGCVWLVCFVWMGFVTLLNFNPYYRRLTAVFMWVLSLTVMVFCSLSVLCVLLRPRPGKVGGDRVLADQSKRRAVRTLVIIMVVVWLKVGGSVVLTLIKVSLLLKCTVEALTFVISLPSGVVLPLLYLHRAGKLPACKCSTASG